MIRVAQAALFLFGEFKKKQRICWDIRRNMNLKGKTN